MRIGRHWQVLGLCNGIRLPWDQSLVASPTGMKLPEAFTTPDDKGVRGGCEFGFMSTTLTKKVAMGYATSGKSMSSTVRDSPRE